MYIFCRIQAELTDRVQHPSAVSELAEHKRAPVTQVAVVLACRTIPPDQLAQVASILLAPPLTQHQNTISAHVLAILLAPPPTRHQAARSAHVASILLAPPMTQRYATVVVAEGVSGELRCHV